VILDFSLPGKSGFDVLSVFRQRHPYLPVLFFSALPEEQFAMRAIRAGASGYLAKDAPEEEIATAIRTIVRGGRYVSAVLAENLVRGDRRDDEKLPHEKLSEREFQVFWKM